MNLTPGAARLRKLRKAAAKELQLPVTDPAVIRLATLQAAYDQIQAKIVSGQSFDVPHMMLIDSALAEVRKANKPLPSMQIGFVRSVFEVCQRCHESQEFVCRSCGHTESIEDFEARRRERELPPSVPPSPAPQIEAKPVAKSAGEPASNVVPLRPSEAPDCQPVYQVSQDWRQHVAPVGGGNCNPFSAAGDPNPNFGPGGRSRY